MESTEKPLAAIKNPRLSRHETKRILARLRDSPWYQSAVSLHRDTAQSAVTHDLCDRVSKQDGGEEGIGLGACQNEEEASVSENGTCQLNEYVWEYENAKGGTSIDVDPDSEMKAEDPISSHLQSAGESLSLRDYSPKTGNCSKSSDDIVVTNESNEATSGEGENITLKGECKIKPSAQPTDAKLLRQSNEKYNSLPLKRKDVSGSQKPMQNLSTCPISVIAIRSSKTMPGEFAETTFTIKTKESETFRGENERSNPPLPRSGDQGVDNAPSSKTSAVNTHQKNKCTDMSPRKSDRPTARRRLSRTIQLLQEKLQQEIANNENRPSSENPTGPKATEPKKLSGKAVSRFARERSRRRSKSRAALKVFHSGCTRRHPPTNAKERPYRQWAGVGSCVTSDCRYIVSSTRSREKLSLAKSIEANEVSSHEKSGDAAEVSTKNTFCLDEDCGKKIKTLKALGSDDQMQRPSSEVSKKNIPEDKCHDDELKLNGGVVDSAKSGDIMLQNKSTKNLMLSSKTEMDLNEQDFDTVYRENARLSISSSFTAERSRCIKRMPSSKDRQSRPPTPHCKSSRRNAQVFSATSTVSSPRLEKAISGSEVSPTKPVKSDGPPEILPRKLIALARLSPSVRGHRERYGYSSKPRLNCRSTVKPFTSGENVQTPERLRGGEGKRVGSSSSEQRGGSQEESNKGGAWREILAGSSTSLYDSLEAAWSDVSTTTCESSAITEVSSVSNTRRDVCNSNEDLSRAAPRKPLVARAEEDGATSVDLHQLAGGAGEIKRYVDVQAIVDFKATFPGQLSFRKGQIIKQIVCSSSKAADEMSYGYYRVGRFRRKRKGLFPTSCVIQCRDNGSRVSVAQPDI